MQRKNFVFAGSFFLLGGLLSASAWLSPWQMLNAQSSTNGAPSRQQEYADLDREAGVFDQQSRLLRKVVELSGPCIVHIDAKKQGAASRVGGNRFVEEAGSGIIVEDAGQFYVITNRHVVKDAENQRITIRLDDGRELNPRKVTSDPDTDIAVMSITGSNLEPARLGNSDNIMIGDFVLAIGSPFGLSRSVTFGIISAKGRRDLELGGDEIRFQDFIQTDAAINPGNSGGPLINMRGEVVGLNTAIASSSGGNEGIGFSIPINMVMFVARQLIASGEVNRAFLGVNLDSRFSADAAAQLGLPRLQGARVSGITANSPAAAGGLLVGDVVLEFNNKRVESDVHLVNLVGLTPPGEEVEVLVFRGGRTVKLRFKLGNRKLLEQQSSLDLPPYGDETPANRWELPELGLSVIDLTPELLRGMQIQEPLQGLMVTDVDARGPSAGRLRRGDIIHGVERTTIGKVNDLQRVLQTVDARNGVRLHVLPSGATKQSLRTVIVRPELPRRR